jgi:hypothetical protein
VNSNMSPSGSRSSRPTGCANWNRAFHGPNPVTPAQPVQSPGLALTVRHLQGTVQNVADLSAVRVGAVSGSSTVDTLTRITKLVMANTAVVNIEDHLAFH